MWTVYSQRISFVNVTKPLFHGVGNRVNTNSEYAAFTNYATERFRTQLIAQNELDIELYRLVLRKLRKDLNNLGLLNHPLVKEYWDAKALSNKVF